MQDELQVAIGAPAFSVMKITCNQSQVIKKYSQSYRASLRTAETTLKGVDDELEIRIPRSTRLPKSCIANNTKECPEVVLAQLS